MANFIDRVTLHIQAGKGGDGIASVRRENSSRLVAPMGRTAGTEAT